ncbi:hypothetical protein QJ48_10685 [Paenibacillus sp. A3]|uniref:hypothetical protein n=1 Tax=Paenibacillus sp. A3 TaxID=1337054 RepID=UPI0006D597E6|nr:hypothetical protein [Paenibacillus sp. A3]KPV59538.1 hypothetical protein QJ48_10685 [Paenibacillus sp. A3]
MKRIIEVLGKRENAIFLGMGGVLLLGGLVWGATFWNAGAVEPSVPPTQTESSGERAKVISDPDANRAQDSTSGFPPLEVTRSKINKGYMATVKQGRVLEQVAAPDGATMVYLVQRTKTGDNGGSSRIDALWMAPQSESAESAPIAQIAGTDEDTIRRATRLCGFTNKDEFVYTTVKNEGSELVYYVNRFSMKQRTSTPLLELYRHDSNGRPAPAVLEAKLAPDKRHVLVRDERSGIASYDLKTGAQTRIVPGSEAVRVGETFLLAPEAGVGLYAAGRFQSDLWWFDWNTGGARQPFVAEPGMVDAGMDAGRKLIYYNWTYDRKTELAPAGDKRTLLASSGVQLADVKANPLKRFSLPKDSKEHLEFGGYNEERKTVLLHQFQLERTAAPNGTSAVIKKTTAWLLGDLKTGTMQPLQQVEVPDGWELKDMAFGSVLTDGGSDTPAEQVFVNMQDRTYYRAKWKTKQPMVLPEEDLVLFADEPSKRVFVSSLTRPDLVVAALNYKKYNWDNQEFAWLNGHWMSRYHKAAEGDKIFFFQIN